MCGMEYGGLFQSRRMIFPLLYGYTMNIRIGHDHGDCGIWAMGHTSALQRSGQSNEPSMILIFVAMLASPSKHRPVYVVDTDG